MVRSTFLHLSVAVLSLGIAQPAFAVNDSIDCFLGFNNPSLKAMKLEREAAAISAAVVQADEEPDCIETLTEDDRKKVSEFLESSKKSQTESESISAQDMGSIEKRFQALTHNQQIAAAALLQRAFTDKLVTTLQSDAAFAKAYLKFDEAVTAMAAFQGGGVFDYMLGETRYGRLTRRLDEVAQELLSSIQESSAEPAFKTAVISSIIKTRLALAQKSGLELQLDHSRIQRAKSIDQVYIGGAVSTGLIVGSILTFGLLTPAAKVSAAATGLALATVLRTAAIVGSGTALGVAGAVGLQKTAELLLNSKDSSKLYKQSYFCSLAKELHERGNDAIFDSFKAGVVAGFAGAAIAMLPLGTAYAAGTFGASAATAARVGGFVRSVTIGGALVGGTGLGLSESWHTYNESKAMLFRSRMAALDGNEAEARELLELSQRKANEAGLTTVSTLIGAALASKGLSALKKNLNRLLIDLKYSEPAGLFPKSNRAEAIFSQLAKHGGEVVTASGKFIFYPAVAPFSFAVSAGEAMNAKQLIQVPLKFIRKDGVYIVGTLVFHKLAEANPSKVIHFLTNNLDESDYELQTASPVDEKGVVVVVEGFDASDGLGAWAKDRFESKYQKINPKARYIEATSVFHLKREIERITRDGTKIEKLEIAAHGLPGSIMINGEMLNISSAHNLKMEGALAPGAEIRLISCLPGANSRIAGPVGDDFLNALGTAMLDQGGQVTASTRIVWAYTTPPQQETEKRSEASSPPSEKFKKVVEEVMEEVLAPLESAIVGAITMGTPDQEKIKRMSIEPRKK